MQFRKCKLALFVRQRRRRRRRWQRRWNKDVDCNSCWSCCVALCVCTTLTHTQHKRKWIHLALHTLDITYTHTPTHQKLQPIICAFFVLWILFGTIFVFVSLFALRCQLIISFNTKHKYYSCDANDNILDTHKTQQKPNCRCESTTTTTTPKQKLFPFLRPHSHASCSFVFRNKEIVLEAQINYGVAELYLCSVNVSLLCQCIAGWTHIVLFGKLIIPDFNRSDSRSRHDTHWQLMTMIDNKLKENICAIECHSSSAFCHFRSIQIEWTTIAGANVEKATEWIQRLVWHSHSLRSLCVKCIFNLPHSSDGTFLKCATHSSVLISFLHLRCASSSYAIYCCSKVIKIGQKLSSRNDDNRESAVCEWAHCKEETKSPSSRHDVLFQWSAMGDWEHQTRGLRGFLYRQV